MSSRFIYAVAHVRISILFEAENYLVMCVRHVLFICLPVDGHLCGFHLLAFVSSAAHKVSLHLRYPAASYSHLCYGAYLTGE